MKTPNYIAPDCGGLGLVTEGAMITHEAKHAEVKDNEVPTITAIRGLATLITKGHTRKGREY